MTLFMSRYGSVKIVIARNKANKSVYFSLVFAVRISDRDRIDLCPNLSGGCYTIQNLQSKIQNPKSYK